MKRQENEKASEEEEDEEDEEEKLTPYGCFAVVAKGELWYSVVGTGITITFGDGGYIPIRDYPNSTSGFYVGSANESYTFKNSKKNIVRFYGNIKGLSFYRINAPNSGLRKVMTAFPETMQMNRYDDCFRNCDRLSDFPDDLFWYCSKRWSVTSVRGCFAGAKSIRKIPSQFFRGIGKCQDYSECFMGCLSLHEVGSLAFGLEGGLADTPGQHLPCDFNYCFAGCRFLRIVDPTAFYNFNDEIRSLVSCFEGCGSLINLDYDLFDRSSNSIANVTQCFSGCKRLVKGPAFYSETSYYPKIQEFEKHEKCYYDCGSFAGGKYYSDRIVPDDWK